MEILKRNNRKYSGDENFSNKQINFVEKKKLSEKEMSQKEMCKKKS